MTPSTKIDAWIEQADADDRKPFDTDEDTIEEIETITPARSRLRGGKAATIKSEKLQADYQQHIKELEIKNARLEESQRAAQGKVAVCRFLLSSLDRATVG